MFVGHLENIFVPDLNNPDVSLNAFQVWDKFETNCTKTQKLKQIAQRRKKNCCPLEQAIKNWMENSGPYVMVDSPDQTNPACL